jgi:hypothetical protein
MQLSHAALCTNSLTQNEEVETNNKRVRDNQYDHLHAARLIP